MASNPENVRLTVLMKLQEALDEEAILEEQMLALMHRFADRFTDRRVEINNLMALHDHQLIDYVEGGDFSVASVRRSLDDIRLPCVSTQTRWIKEVPIKVNVLAWKVRLDCLPSRLNLSRRGLPIPSILCPMCGIAVESTSLFFFGCSVYSDILRKICSWWMWVTRTCACQKMGGIA
ncbi:RNA-directed DNA polymerase, eukaryota [Tanacetum coccineum]